MIQSFGVECSESFIDEQRFQAHITGVVLDNIRQPQSE
jgi:hypothetical protein